ncbi:MAG: anthranilate synthase component I family protein [bacterium]
MSIPRRHSFRRPADVGACFRTLPTEHRFRLAGPGRPEVIGAEPRTIVSRRRTDRGDAPSLEERLRTVLPRVPSITADGAFPGGALGVLGYEFGYPRVNLPLDPRPAPGPLAWFGVYDTFATFREDTVEIVSWGLDESGSFDSRLALRRAKELEERLRGASAAPRSTEGEDSDTGSLPLPVASLDEAGHAERVGEVLAAIRRGDVYQANLTVRFDVPTRRDALSLFETLLRDNPAPFATYLETDEGTVISCSPERMLAAHGRRLTTRPIKGTAPRAIDPDEDARLARRLLESAKDRAELLMITDLERNDLGRVCRIGSVRVPELLTCESYPHVHHLVSTIVGELAPGRDVFDALDALFPYGSITGTPKRRATELLRELEPTTRGVYTGTVGWIGFDRSADFAVAIRTGVHANGVFSFGAGGGIVIDSDPASEWRELQWKARAFALALDTSLESPSAGGL